MSNVERTRCTSIHETFFETFGLNALREWLIRKLGGVPCNTKSDIVKHAKTELGIMYAKKDFDEIVRILNQDIVDLVSVYSYQQHSEISSCYVSNALFLIMNNRILTPLTGKDEEWKILEDGDQEFYAQNRRCPHVFMRMDGSCFDIEGVSYVGKDEDYRFSGETNSDSVIEVEFPYLPNKKIVFLDEDGNEIGHIYEEDSR